MSQPAAQCARVCTRACSAGLKSPNYLRYFLIYLHNVKRHDAKQEVVEARWTPYRGYDVMVQMLARRSVSSWLWLSISLSV